MKRIIALLMVIACLGVYARAEEGMWLLTQIKDIDLAKEGIQLTVEDIYAPGKVSMVDGVVSLGGGTAELVSPNGLLLTNHHVAFGAVQRASTAGSDFITKGFLARTLEEEIQAPGYSAWVLLEMKDVTAELAKFNSIKNLVERQKAIDRKRQEIKVSTEKGKTDIEARIQSMYSGKVYYLFVYKRYDDLRVVYVPPMSIGNYGGDIDNWMWPRHTGDFSYMRIYTAPDGTGRKYDKANVPYKPKKWFKVAAEPLKDGDQTFVLGYPGGTNRYNTASSVDFIFNYQYPFYIKYATEVIQLLEKFSADSQIAKAKLAGLHKGLNNGMKNTQGNVDGMKRTNFLQKKQAFEDELMAFLKKDDKLNAKYGNVLKDISAHYATEVKKADRKNSATAFGRMGGSMLSLAMAAYGVVKEREKPTKERNPNFNEKTVERQVQRLDVQYMSFYEPCDRVLAKKALNLVGSLPEGQRYLSFDQYLKNIGMTVDQWVDMAYDKSTLKDAAVGKGLFTKTSKELLAMNDPFINLAAALYDEREKERKEDEAWGAKDDELTKQFIESLYAWKGSRLYPDANGTMRFTYGRIKGYQPRDAVYYKPFTYLKGMLEKDTAVEPFDMMPELKELYAKKDFGRWGDPENKDIAIAFTHLVDSTGGNSGSPVFNAKGELAGILFDGNYEAMTCDWMYDLDIQRTISVDIRFVMFVTEKVAKADNILKEMGL